MFRVLILGFWLLGALPVWAQNAGDGFPEEPELRVTLLPNDVVDGGTYVQSQIVLQVRVVSRWPFEQLNLDVPVFGNVRQVRLVGPRNREARTMAGNGFLHEVSYALFPSHTGSLRVHAIEVTGVSAGPDGDIPFSDQSAAQTIQVKSIAQNYDDPWWLSASRIEMTESWSKPVEDIRFGEVVRREVQIAAFGVMEEQLPLIEHNRTRGLSVSGDGETTRTELTPSGLVTYRTQAWTLKLDGSGFVYIPPLALNYWNTEEKAVQKANVRGYRLEPLPADRAAISEQLMAEAMANYRADQKYLAAFVALITVPLLAIALLFIWIALPTRWDFALLSRIRSAGANNEEKIRAVEEWRRRSNISLPSTPTRSHGVPESYANLRAEFFGKDSVESEQNFVARDLISYARRSRLKAFVDRTRIGGRSDPAHNFETWCD